MFYSYKSIWTLLKNEMQVVIVIYFCTIDIFEMTTYASLREMKSSFITLCPQKGLQLTEKSSSYRMHYTLLLHDDWNRNNDRLNVMKSFHFCSVYLGSSITSNFNSHSLLIFVWNLQFLSFDNFKCAYKTFFPIGSGVKNSSLRTEYHP